VAKIIPHKTQSRKRASRGFHGELVGAFLLGALLVGASQFLFGPGHTALTLPKIGGELASPRPAREATREEATTAVSFTICGSARRDDCVIDGDTFWYGGEKIRIADIDAPETHPPRCDFEARLGAKATQRLLQLLNEAPFVLRTQDRDEDRYGRKLRIVVSGGRSVGGILVSEGLAREWTGHREPWCSA
jgi:endonuclease YncB( thermonuclease family)